MGATQDQFTRTLGDVNGDGRDDIVGFGQAGVFVSLATGSGGIPTFAAPQFVLGDFGATTGWTSDNVYHRELADVTRDGREDIVGFGNSGVFVALATEGGNFSPASFELAGFGPNAGAWSSQDLYPRHLGDIDGDHAADIVGFGMSGAWKSQSIYHFDLS